ncbi:hypothetical protein QVO32_13840 [Bacteroides gallinaceum]|uniref:hypothetical protein n=1 Tax=Bacteroides gallinaceum TaxID=1462571 RepID=UPI0025AAEE70|nr:hypothetical protein [Bacteroides gallinaceum]MDN0080483.1 hypothetical protein [Bacteroides gallinaceum]
MNKRHYLMAAMCLMTLAACTQKTELPEDPKDKEEYRDSQGNSWIYNAMLMRWALMPSAMNGLTTTHYYYPNTGSWTDANGTRVDAPSGVKVSSPAGSKSKSSGRVFGSSHRSSGVHA